MSGELVPAWIAAGGGAVMLAIIVASEHRRDQRMRAGRVRASLTFPFGTTPAAALRALESLAGVGEGFELVVEVAASGEQITHRLYLPAEIAEAVGSQLRMAVPGLRITPEDAALAPVTLVLRVVVPSRVVLRTTDPEGASRSLLAALLPLRAGEVVAVRWALRSGQPAADAELSAHPREAERHHERAWQTKLRAPGVFACGLVSVQAGDVRRARALASRVTAVLATRRAGRSALVIRRLLRPVPLPRASRRSGWLSLDELLPCLGLPLGTDAIAGVQVGAARQIAARKELPRLGRPLLVADHHGAPRQVALSPEAARHHAVVLGSTGSGKSALLARGILSDIAAGYGGVVLDPKSDLIADVLDRVPVEHVDRIAVIDPTDPGPTLGIDLFASGDADLRADTLLAVFRALSEAWGPRLDALLRMGLRTVAEIPGGSLLDLPRLYLDPVFRRQVVARLRDPLLLAEWQAFGALSEAERAQYVAAPMTRVMSLIGRPAVRAVLAQPDPRLDVARLLRQRGWLMVSAASGVLGAPAARLIGAVVTYVVWAHIAARAAVPVQQRHRLSLYFDELTAVADQALGIEALAEQGRGFNASLTIATQAAGRLPEAVRTALFSNVATLVSFTAGADEAARIARELRGIDARDLQALQPFEVAARVGIGRGAGSTTVTGHTEPLGPPTGQAERIRRLSAQRWGRSREEIEAATFERYGTSAPSVDPDDLGRTERRS